MTTDIQKLIDLFDLEEERRFQEEKDHPESFLLEKGQNKFEAYHNHFVDLLKQHDFGKTSPTGETLDSMHNYNISIDEASLVYMYTLHMFSIVNYQLRNHSTRMDKDYFEYSEQLNSVLDKLPSYDNKIVYRDVCFLEKDISEILESYEKNIGEVVIENSFLSTHIESLEWRDKINDLRFIIHTKHKSNGKDLRELSFNSNEQEVLFKKFTSFIVKDVFRSTNIVELIEK